MWRNLANGETTVQEAVEALGNARDSGTQLTVRSAKLLSMESDEAAEKFVDDNKHLKLKRMVRRPRGRAVKCSATPVAVGLGGSPALSTVASGDATASLGATHARARASSASPQTVITCMCTLNKDNESVGAVGCLVIGTEAGEARSPAPSPCGAGGALPPHAGAPIYHLTL